MISRNNESGGWGDLRGLVQGPEQLQTILEDVDKTCEMSTGPHPHFKSQCSEKPRSIARARLLSGDVLVLLLLVFDTELNPKP